MIPGKKYKPEDFVQIAVRRRWLIVVPAIAIAVATIVISHFVPNQYKAQTSMLVVPQQVSESYVRSSVTTRMEDRLRSISQQILSRARLERVIQDFNLYPDLRRSITMEDVVERMRKDITIEPIKGDAFWVTFVSNDPRTAMSVAERLGSMFIEENLRDREVLAEGTDQFLEAQLDDARRRLVDHEKRLEGYRRKYAGELPSQQQSNLQVVQNTQIQVQTLTESINRDRDRRLILERTLADLTVVDRVPAASSRGGLATDPLGPQSGTTTEQLEAAKTALQSMELRLTAQHPDIRAMKRIIRDLEKKAEAEQSTRPLDAGPRGLTADEVTRQNRIRDAKAELENLDRQLAHKQDEEKQLRDTITLYQNRAEAAPSRESELIELMRDYDTLQKIYTGLLAKKEDSKIAANLERRQIGEQFKILDPARLPEKPFSPDRVRINLFGSLAGLAFGIGLAAFFEYRDSSLRTDEDVTGCLALPVLAMVPMVTTASERRAGVRNRIIASAAAATVFVVSLAAIVWKLAR